MLSKSKIFLVQSIFFLIPFRELRITSFMTFQDLLLLIVFLLLLRGNLTSGIEKIFLIGFLLTSILFLVSSMNTVSVSSNLVSCLKVFFAYVIPLIVIIIFTSNSSRGASLFNSFILGTSVSVLFSQIFKIESITSQRDEGFGGHPIFYGTNASLAILLALAQINRKNRFNFLLALSIPINTYAIIGSQSVTALIMLCIGLVTLSLIFSSKNGKFVFVSIFSGLICLKIIQNIFSEIISRGEGGFSQITLKSLNESTNSTLALRIESLRQSWNKIKIDWIFGYGLDKFGRVTPMGLEPHNSIFMAWQTGGIFFLLIHVLFLSWVIYNFFRNFRFSKSLFFCVVPPIVIDFMSGPMIYGRSEILLLLLAIYLSPKLK